MYLFSTFEILDGIYAGAVPEAKPLAGLALRASTRPRGGDPPQRASLHKSMDFDLFEAEPLILRSSAELRSEGAKQIPFFSINVEDGKNVTKALNILRHTEVNGENYGHNYKDS